MNDSYHDDDDGDNRDVPTSSVVTPDLVSYVKKLPKKPDTTIRIMTVQRGLYVVVGDDALFLAKDLRKTREGVKDHTDVGCYLVQSQQQFEREVRDILLVKQYRLEVHSKTGTKNGSWSCEYTSTPGNFGPLEEVLYSARDNLDARGVVVISCGDGGRSWSCVFFDSVSKIIRVTSFQDDQHLSCLESVLVQFAPREAVLSTTISKKNELLTKLTLNNITPTEVELKEYFLFTDQYLTDSLKRILLQGSISIKQVESFLTSLGPGKKTTCACLSAGIKYLGLLGSKKPNHFEFDPVSLTSFVKLDGAAVASLHLVSTCQEKQSGKDVKTVLGILNNCRTQGGQRLLSQWLRQPLVDYRRIEERLHLVQFFVEERGIRDTLSEDRLRKIPDLVKLSRKFSSSPSGNQMVSLQDMYSLFLLTRDLSSLAELIGEENMYARTTFTDKIRELSEEFEKYNSLITDIMDFDRIKSHREYRIKATFDDDLDDLTRLRDELEAKIEQMKKRVERDLGSNDSVKLGYDKQSGDTYFVISNKFEVNLRAKKQMYDVLPNPKKDGIRFTCEELEETNPKLSEVRAQIEGKEKEILTEVGGIVCGYSYTVKLLSDLISLLDVYVSLAVTASTGEFVRPEIREPGSGVIQFTKLRHPCVEAVTCSGFIPNDVDMRSDGSKFLLVTGPNMGGKSTYIRSIAIGVLLAQIGSFVPAESATISVVDGIYTRVGGSDQQMMGNSTFFAEMIETANIIRSATENSLIVIDELGRGTSTYDGFGIAYAVSKHIVEKKKSFCLFATHFKELVRLERDCPGSVSILQTGVVVNQDSHKVTLTHEIKPGPCFKSFGIEVARMAGIPDDYIRRAEDKLRELEEGAMRMGGGGGEETRDDPLQLLKQKFDLNGMIAEVKKNVPTSVDQMTDDEVNKLISRMTAFVK